MIYLVLRVFASRDAQSTLLEWLPRGVFPIYRGSHFM